MRKDLGEDLCLCCDLWRVSSVGWCLCLYRWEARLASKGRVLFARQRCVRVLLLVVGVLFLCGVYTVREALWARAREHGLGPGCVCVCLSVRVMLLVVSV